MAGTTRFELAAELSRQSERPTNSKCKQVPTLALAQLCIGRVHSGNWRARALATVQFLIGTRATGIDWSGRDAHSDKLTYAHWPPSPTNNSPIVSVFVGSSSSTATVLHCLCPRVMAADWDTRNRLPSSARLAVSRGHCEPNATDTIRRSQIASSIFGAAGRFVAVQSSDPAAQRPIVCKRRNWQQSRVYRRSISQAARVLYSPPAGVGGHLERPLIKRRAASGTGALCMKHSKSRQNALARAVGRTSPRPN